MKKILVVAGPSGIGKTYLAELLMTRFPGVFEQGDWYTTRQPRPNEVFTDRIFVSESEFLKREKAGQFFIAEKFHDNWYGLPNSLFQKNKHVIVNTWPGLIPRFIDKKGTLLLGLTVEPESSLNLLKARMAKRGYTEKQMLERLELAQKDINDMNSVASNILQNGKIFTIKDNSTLGIEVIPWVETQIF
ncbi:MAG TPA: hypothetical protein VLG25_02450 [Patescibacteria group bacterium]|nr:hypothetical protein [Patescibacteria group bacterium]